MTDSKGVLVAYFSTVCCSVCIVFVFEKYISVRNVGAGVYCVWVFWTTSLSQMFMQVSENLFFRTGLPFTCSKSYLLSAFSWYGGSQCRSVQSDAITPFFSTIFVSKWFFLLSPLTMETFSCPVLVHSSEYTEIGKLILIFKNSCQRRVNK